MGRGMTGSRNSPTGGRDLDWSTEVKLALAGHLFLGQALLHVLADSFHQPSWFGFKDGQT